jgi:hypothetical protein
MNKGWKSLKDNHTQQDHHSCRSETTIKTLGEKINNRVYQNNRGPPRKSHWSRSSPPSNATLNVSLLHHILKEGYEPSMYTRFYLQISDFVFKMGVVNWARLIAFSRCPSSPCPSRRHQRHRPRSRRPSRALAAKRLVARCPFQ